MAHSATRAIRLHLIEALEKRAGSHDGEVRRILDERLSSLLEAHVDDVGGTAGVVGDAAGRPLARGALGGLVDDLATGGAERPPSAYPEMVALDEFQGIWSRISMDSRMRQSLENVPTDAGPLNSSALVHRSIELMRELSPGYLQHFLAYVDDLSWMARISGSTAPASNQAPGAASIGKRSRKKHRTA